MRTACKAQHKESESSSIYTGKLVDQANKMYNKTGNNVMVCTAQNHFEEMYARRIALLTD